MTKPIVLEDQVWLAARSIVGPGVTVGSGAVLSLGSIASRDLLAWKIYQGSPAIAVKPRQYMHHAAREAHYGELADEVSRTAADGLGRTN